MLSLFLQQTSQTGWEEGCAGNTLCAFSSQMNSSGRTEIMAVSSLCKRSR